MRTRITFAKTDAMRFTGHLDLHKAWERTFRRAELPLAYTEGFSPHPRLTLASALPLGFTGDAEILDAWLESELPTEKIQQKLDQACPPGIQVLQVTVVDLILPALQKELEANEYTITLLDPCPGIEGRVKTILDTPILMREKRGKTFDLRPLILDLQILPDDPAGCQRLAVRLAAREGATGRPEEVLGAMQYPAEAARFHRTGLIFK